MKKTLALFLMFMIAVSLICIFVSPSYGQSFEVTTDLQVKSYTSYMSPAAAFAIVGEVQNVGSDIIQNPGIRVVINDTTGRFLAEQVSSRVFADQISPGDTAPFIMHIVGQTSITGDLSWVNSGIGSIEFTCFGTASNIEFDSGLIVAANNTSADADGNYIIEGILLNTGDTYPQKSYVAGTFYNSNGEVIAIGFTDYLANYLAPGDSVQFAFGLFDILPSAASQIASYKLRAIAEGLLTQTPPTQSPTISPLPSTPLGTASGTSTAPTATDFSSPSVSNDALSSKTLYIVIAIIAIIVAAVIIALVLKRSKTKSA